MIKFFQVTALFISSLFSTPIMAQDVQFSELYNVMLAQEELEEHQRHFCNSRSISFGEECIAKYEAHYAAFYEITETTVTKMQPADVNDYRQWFAGYVANGDFPTHVYDREWSGSNWYVATEDFRLPKLFGTLAVRVIVPEGITYDASNSDLGHSKVYLMNDFSHFGTWVPIYEGL